MKYLAIVTLCLGVAACTKDPVSTSGTNNGQIQIAELFTHNGVTVYRFEDGGRYVYFSQPPANIQAKSTENCGKNCWKSVTVQTLAQQ